ncbi:hypothetical protein AVEN_203424-1 [Araneus ventricosus]|uniref:RNase H type-1 domain-containing protein n=1 Tax=Araneus ventricosus TaxID=182803 RepID=A0A4Y2RDP3_ARAVE|nr:hypothetical protein AVEN_203424-1 [Araneus ventricosus]
MISYGLAISGELGLFGILWRQKLSSPSMAIMGSRRADFSFKTYSMAALLSRVKQTMIDSHELGARLAKSEDNRSSINDLKGRRTKSKFFNGIKENPRLAEGLMGLSWVKAHVGIPGKELADRFVK